MRSPFIPGCVFLPVRNGSKSNMMVLDQDRLGAIFSQV